MKELDQVIVLAKASNNPSAHVAALNLKRKISGLKVNERRNALSPVSGMTYEQMKAALDALAAFRKAQITGN